MFVPKHSYAIFFPPNLKIFWTSNIRKWGAKIILNSTFKMNRHTNRQVNTQREKSTYRKQRAVALKSFTEWTTHKQDTEAATYRLNRPLGQLI